MNDVVVVVEDCCAAATDALHVDELKILNMIYCHVAGLKEVVGFMESGAHQH